MATKHLTALSLLVPMSLFAAIGCEGDKPKDGEISTSSKTAAESSAKAEPKEAKGVTAAEFGDQVVENACKTVTDCKNEELRSLFENGLMMAVTFALMKEEMKPDPDLKTFGDKMKSEKRSLMTADECNTLGKKVASMMGIGTDVLPKLVKDKKIAFDADKAKACVESLASAPKTCSEAKKVEGEAKMSQIVEFEKKYKGELDSFIKPCEGAVKGQAKDGEKCEHDLVCVSGNCEGEKGEQICAPKG